MTAGQGTDHAGQEALLREDGGHGGVLRAEPHSGHQPSHSQTLMFTLGKVTTFPQFRVNNSSNKYVIYFSQGYAGSPQHHIQPYALLNSCMN